jgi:outer membrane immunogenic protein
MKRIISALMFSLIGAGGALAADLPPAPPPQAPAMYVPVVAPVYNWGGIYVGINGGYGWGSVKYTTPTIQGPGGAINGISGTANDNGGVVGGTLGFNYQMGAFVWGAEGDFDWSGINTGTSNSVCNLTGQCQTGNNWLATIRGRVGYAADRVLFYGTGGGAFAGIKTTFDGTETSHSQIGWTAGLGVEMAFADNWTAKVEYLYVDLGSKSATGTCSNAACNLAAGGAPGAGLSLPASVNANLTESLVRVGVNYKFNF